MAPFFETSVEPVNVDALVGQARIACHSFQYDETTFARQAYFIVKNEGHGENIELMRKVFLALAASRNKQPDPSVVDRQVQLMRERMSHETSVESRISSIAEAASMGVAEQSAEDSNALLVKEIAAKCVAKAKSRGDNFVKVMSMTRITLRYLKEIGYTGDIETIKQRVAKEIVTHKNVTGAPLFLSSGRVKKQNGVTQLGVTQTQKAFPGLYEDGTGVSDVQKLQLALQYSGLHKMGNAFEETLAVCLHALHSDNADEERIYVALSFVLPLYHPQVVFTRSELVAALKKYEELSPTCTDEDVESMHIDPDKPTKAKPGSEEKVLLLEERYQRGLSLWNYGDVVDHILRNQRLSAWMGGIQDSQAGDYSVSEHGEDQDSEED